MRTTEHYLAEVDQYSARNYKPLPVVIEKGKGAWVWDVEGKNYLDCLSAYSALNQGHCHPKIVAAARAQLDRVTLTSRAFHNDQMGPFLKKVCEVSGFPKVLPMNTGAEAVETAIKAVRKWGYKVKGVPAGQAEIITCENNFHGRTTTVISFSTEAQYQDGFGPLTPGFKTIPYGDAAALEKAITKNTVAFLVEPIQGEGGVLLPPDGYLKQVREICTRHRVLFVADEIQTGLGRTGKMFACDWEDVKPDAMTLGKALSGGCYPVSAFVSTEEVMGVFNPGDHGSTFGGNPLGAAIGLAALNVLIEENLAERARQIGDWFMGELRKIKAPHIKEVRGKGLLIGVELTGPARPYCEALMERGILAKETHDHVVRFAPPLVIEKQDLEWALTHIREVLAASMEPAGVS
ncbi:MAG TPA: ornithine--oxo-acid transaminase [Gemmatimonadales bacterium]|nr:ornithine--oxo-acid transaminase [Gemmatimonadales bacterium]